MLRTLQRVRPLGGCVTVVSTFVTVAVASDTGRPERGASSNPASRSSANRRRQTPTVCGVVSSSAAMSRFSHCWAANRTMRARKTSCCGKTKTKTKTGRFLKNGSVLDIVKN